MNEPEKETASPKKRHYVPVLPQPRPDTLQNAKLGNARFQRNKRLGRKLDELLGAVDED